MRWLALGLLPLLLAGGSPGPFRLVDFGERGRITQKTWVDLDGDGRKEILLFRGARVSLFRADAGGRFDPRSPRVIDLDPNALLFDLGQVDGDAKTTELVLLTPKGVTYHPFEAGGLAKEPRLLVPAETLVTRGQRGDLHWRGFLRDLDGDGLPDLILATLMGFGIYYQQKPGHWPKKPDVLVPYTLRTTLTVDPPGLAGRILGTVGVPDFEVEDLTGNGRADLLVEDGRTLRVFAAGKDGRLSGTAVREMDLSPLASADGTLPPLVVRDVSGDGRPDIILSRKEQGITDIFLAGGGFEKPDVRIKIPGWSFEPRLEDLDGDGRPDLVIPSTPELGSLNAVSVWLKNAIPVETRIFLNTGDARAPFAKEPTVQREISVSVRLYIDVTGQIRAAHYVLASYDGDFDGDGRKDLLIREDSDELCIYPGVEKGVFSTSAALEIEIPDTEGYAAVESSVSDIDGDGKPDVALFYRSRDRLGDRLVLLLSAKE